MNNVLMTVQEVADLLRVKRNTVYEMLKRGDLPSAKVGKQLRVRRGDVVGKLAGAPNARTPEQAAPVAARGRTSLVLCGQDPSLDLIAAHVSAEHGMPEVLRSHQGSYNALAALYAGRADIATCHLWDEKTREYNLPYITRLLPGMPALVVRLFGRTAGFYTAAGNPLGLADWADLARPGIRLINREKGSGIRVLIDEKLRALSLSPASIQGYGDERVSHAAVAIAVAGGEGDVGVGIQSVARQVPEVHFVPLQKEWYDMVIPLDRTEEPAMRTLVRFARSDEFKWELDRIGAYDFSESGRIFRL
jgi:putative molybdopterin biosynthesis protein